MNAQSYLEGYGWIVGQPLKRGGLKKPILVKHKKDSKGLGHTKQVHDSWWERVFDGQLKSLQVNTGGSKSLEFNVEQAEMSGIAREISPLYRRFVYGGTLKGTIKSGRVEKATTKVKAPKEKKSKVKAPKEKKSKDKTSKADKKSKDRKSSKEAKDKKSKEKKSSKSDKEKRSKKDKSKKKSRAKSPEMA